MSPIKFITKSSTRPNETLIFLHVPKTAGTTLWLILRRQYSPPNVRRLESFAEAATLTSQEWKDAHVLCGHFPYGVHRLSPKPASSITVLREPLERTLSHYSHWNRDAKGTRTLEDFLNAEMGWTDNLQTRMLAGPEAELLPYSQCDQDVFEAAKRNLTDGISLTALTERFDESLILLQRQFGWKMPCYIPENVGTNRISRDAVPRDLLRQIWERTHWDRQLYAVASKRLDEQIAQAGPAFSTDLRRFRLMNIQYRRMKGLVGSGLLRTLKSQLPLEGQMKLESAVRTFLNAAH